MTDYASRYGTLEGRLICLQIEIAGAIDALERGYPGQVRMILKQAHAEICADLRKISAEDMAERKKQQDAVNALPQILAPRPGMHAIASGDTK